MEDLTITFNEWESLKFVEPKIALLEFRKIQQLVASSNLHNGVKDLRTHSLKSHGEGWKAVLFCYGLAKLLKTIILVCPYEKEDYDAIASNEAKPQTDKTCSRIVVNKKLPGSETI